MGQISAPCSISCTGKHSRKRQLVTGQTAVTHAGTPLQDWAFQEAVGNGWGCRTRHHCGEKTKMPTGLLKVGGNQSIIIAQNRWIKESWHESKSDPKCVYKIHATDGFDNWLPGQSMLPVSRVQSLRKCSVLLASLTACICHYSITNFWFDRLVCKTYSPWKNILFVAKLTCSVSKHVMYFLSRASWNSKMKFVMKQDIIFLDEVILPNVSALTTVSWLIPWI